MYVQKCHICMQSTLVRAPVVHVCLVYMYICGDMKMEIILSLLLSLPLYRIVIIKRYGML